MVVANNPRVKKIAGSKNGRQLFRLSKPLNVFVPLGPGHILLEIPEDFVTDLSSVPTILQPLLSQYSGGYLAPIAHDYLYAADKNVHCTRLMADTLFYELMHLKKIPFLRRYAMFWAVRCFGWLWWKGNK